VTRTDTDTTTTITLDLTIAERVVFLNFATEYGRDLKDGDSVEQTLGSALDKLVSAIRLSADW
jgi:hypothetical protein